MSPNALPQLKTQLKLAPLRQLGTRRLTKAHLVLAQRPGLADQAKQYVFDFAAAVGRELEVKVDVEATLLESRVLPQTHLADHSAFAIFDLANTGGAAILELELPFTTALLSRLATRERTASAPALRLTRIEEATLGYLVLAGLAVGRSSEVEKQFRPRLRRISTDRSVALGPMDLRQLHVVIDLRLSVDGVPGGARLFVPAALVRTAAEMQVRAPLGELAPEIASVDVELRCRSAPVTLSRLELERLRVGDAVVLEDFSLCDAELVGPVRLTSPLFDLVGSATAGSFVFDRALVRNRPQEFVMSLPDRTEVTPPLPVEVEVELTRVRLSLAELAVLKSGAILPLQITVSEPVTLRIGDRVIARAELVDIGGEVAARILSLTP